MFIFSLIFLHNLITSYYICFLINPLFIRVLTKNNSPCVVGYYKVK
jgi:hypothetical protein